MDCPKRANCLSGFSIPLDTLLVRVDMSLVSLSLVYENRRAITSARPQATPASSAATGSNDCRCARRPEHETAAGRDSARGTAASPVLHAPPCATRGTVATA